MIYCSKENKCYQNIVFLLFNYESISTQWNSENNHSYMCTPYFSTDLFWKVLFLKGKPTVEMPYLYLKQKLITTSLS